MLYWKHRMYSVLKIVVIFSAENKIYSVQKTVITSSFERDYIQFWNKDYIQNKKQWLYSVQKTVVVFSTENSPISRPVDVLDVWCQHLNCYRPISTQCEDPLNHPDAIWWKPQVWIGCRCVSQNIFQVFGLERSEKPFWYHILDRKRELIQFIGADAQLVHWARCVHSSCVVGCVHSSCLVGCVHIMLSEVCIHIQLMLSGMYTADAVGFCSNACC